MPGDHLAWAERLESGRTWTEHVQLGLAWAECVESGRAWAERVQSGLALGSVRDGHASGPCVVCDALFGSCVVRDGGRPADGPDECAPCDSRHASRTSPHWGLRERRTCRSGPPPPREDTSSGRGWLVVARFGWCAS